MTVQEIVKVRIGVSQLKITKAGPPSAVPVFRVAGSDVAVNASQDQHTAYAQNRREFFGWYPVPVMCVKLNVLHEIFSLLATSHSGK